MNCEQSMELLVSTEGMDFLGLVDDYKLQWDSTAQNGQVSE
jgi:hypothetical protein